MQYIREASPDDLPKLVKLASQFYSVSTHLEDFSLDSFCENWSKLITGPGVIFLSTDGTEITGALGGVAYPDINSGTQQAVEFFWWVDPEYRGHGVRLYKAFEEWAKARGCSVLRMMALSDSKPEQLFKFYSRKGFKLVEFHYVKNLCCNGSQG